MAYKVINEAAVRNAELRTHPYRWIALNEIIRDDIAKRMEQEFPEEDFERVRKSGADKNYDMWVRNICPRGANSANNISAIGDWWASLVDDVTSHKYLVGLSSLCDFDLSESEVEVNLWRYAPKSYLSVHTDKPEKMVTQVIYLNSDWKPGFGGTLCLHDDSPQKSISREIPPILNSSLLLITSPKSWHSVKPVSSVELFSRKTIQIIFWSKER